MKKTYTITAALPYTNGPIHIGHLAGVYIPADIFSRFMKLVGHDVLFICGSDEHGVPITIKAKQEDVTPKEIVDRYHINIKKSFEDFSLFIFKGLLRKPLPKCIYNLEKPQCFKCTKPNVKITNKLNF